MPEKNQKYFAVIGDLVASRQMEPDLRNEVQKQFHAVLKKVNEEFREDIASLFLITAGDEMQGILFRPDHCYDMLRKIQLALAPTQIVFGLGYGEIMTELGEYAIGSDGPALHRARQALTEAKEERKAYGKSILREVKINSGNHEFDAVMNALLLALSVLKDSWSENQREIVHLLEQGKAVKQISEILSVPQSNISRTIEVVHFREFVQLVDGVKILFTAGYEKIGSYQKNDN